MKKGIRGHDVLKSGLKNICDRLREIDFEYIQLVLERSVEGFEHGNFSEEYAQSIKKDLGDRKIAVLGSYVNLSDPDPVSLKLQLDKFKEKIRYASVLKPIVVGSETGTYIEGKTHSEEAYQYLLKNVKELVREAEKYDVTVGIEGLHLLVINTPQLLHRLITEVDSKNIKAIFDPCNYLNIDNYMKQDEIINDMFDLLGDKIVAIHAKDFVIENGEMKDEVPGYGMFNYELLFKRMKAQNPDIPVICEAVEDPKAVEGFKKLEKLFDRV